MTRAMICDRCLTVFENGTEMDELEAYTIGKSNRTWKRTVHLCSACASWFDGEVKGVKANGTRATGNAGRDAHDED